MRLWVGLLACFFGSLVFGSQPETFYVQSTHADVHREAKTSGAILLSLNRGASVSVLNKKDSWFEIQTQNGTGWIQKLFLSRYAPSGASELANLPSGTSLEKASRRRPASFAVSAAT